jgi:hypothetical protein
LTTRLESRKKAYKKEKIFLQKSLTRPNRPQYNGVSQGDTPPPPRGGGGGGEQLSCQGGLARFVLRRYLVILIYKHETLIAFPQFGECLF